jgi:hypothetical protein
MKNLKLVILLVLSPLTFFGQQLTGLWMGSLSNDSTSIRQDQSFEIALTEYRGKVYGYSRSTFIVNDTLYYIVKRVKGNIDGGICEVKDDEIVSCNFPKRIEKGVKVIHTFRMNQTDSTWQLDGNWKTTQTKKYYSLTGKSDLAEEKDIDNSKIFPHLEELNLAKEVPFYVTAKKAKDEAITKQLAAERNRPTSISLVQQEGINTDLAVSKPSTAVKTNTVAVDNTILVQEEKIVTNIPTEQIETTKKDVANKPATTVKTNTIAVDNTILVQDEKTPSTTIQTEQQKGMNKPDLAGKPNTFVKTNTVHVKNTIAIPEEKKPQATIAATQQPTASKPNLASSKPNTVPVKTTTPVNKPVVTIPENKTQPAVNKPDLAVNKQPTVVQQQPATTASNPVAAPAKTTTAPVTNEVVSLSSKFDNLKNFKPDATGAAAKIAERKTDAQQTIMFKADSLLIAVYDNGEIDGDTVSVLLNGEVVLSKQGLKASAAKKTIFLPTTTDEEFTLVLYAENLGKYPPNTGLLVVYDGEERHYVRFSADLQKNAGVILKRKR